jgi:hypothetical protein
VNLVQCLGTYGRFQVTPSPEQVWSSGTQGFTSDWRPDEVLVCKEFLEIPYDLASEGTRAD